MAGDLELSPGERDYSLDFDIEMTNEQANRPLTVGEFVSVISKLHNQLHGISWASTMIVEGEVEQYVAAMTDALGISRKIARDLDMIAQNKWVADGE